MFNFSRTSAMKWRRFSVHLERDIQGAGVLEQSLRIGEIV